MLNNTNLTLPLLGIRVVPSIWPTDYELNLTTLKQGVLLDHLTFLNNSYSDDRTEDPKGSPCIQLSSDYNYNGSFLFINNSLFQDNNGGSAAVLNIEPLSESYANFTVMINNTQFIRNFAYCKLFPINLIAGLINAKVTKVGALVIGNCTFIDNDGS